MNALVRSIVLKIAGRCNLNCSYCYMYNHEDQSWRTKPKVMSAEVYDALLWRMRRYCDEHPGLVMDIGFHGGEPTLVGRTRFAEMVHEARRVLGPRLGRLSMQSNAVLIDDDWAELFAEERVDISVSVDGPEEVHDRYRLDHVGKGSYARVRAGIGALVRAGLRPKVICVVAPGSSGARAYRAIRALGVERMDFLSPDVSHDNKELIYGAEGSTPVGDFLVGALDAWLEEDDPAVEIQSFAGLFAQLLGGVNPGEGFGNKAVSYVVVETDGAIEPLDALKVCAEGMTHSQLNVLRNGFDELDAAPPLLRQSLEGDVELSATCKACPEARTCGGAYLPSRYSKARGFDNPSVWCADYRRFFSRLRSHLVVHQGGTQARPSSPAETSVVQESSWGP